MSELVPCPACKKEINARAKVCPKCGKNIAALQSQGRPGGGHRSGQKGKGGSAQPRQERSGAARRTAG